MLSDKIEAYQQQLEAVRIAFLSDAWDDEQRSQLLEDLGKARDAMEVAWCAEIGETTTNSSYGW